MALTHFIACFNLTPDVKMIPLFQAVEAEGQELELDLSNLGAVNTMFAALFRFVFLNFELQLFSLFIYFYLSLFNL